VLAAFVDFPNLRGVEIIEEARQRILSTFRAYTTGLILTSNSLCRSSSNACAVFIKKISQQITDLQLKQNSKLNTPKSSRHVISWNRDIMTYISPLAGIDGIRGPWFPKAL